MHIIQYNKIKLFSASKTLMVHRNYIVSMILFNNIRSDQNLFLNWYHIDVTNKAITLIKYTQKHIFQAFRLNPPTLWKIANTIQLAYEWKNG